MAENRRWKLNSEGIDAASEEIAQFLAGPKTDKKEALRVRLGAEETLLRFRDQFGEETEFELRLSRLFGSIRVSVEIPGRMYDPFVRGDSPEESSAFMRAALAGMGELPVWRYSRGINTVSWRITRRHLQGWAQLLIAIVLAVVVGFLIGLLPKDVSAFISGSIVSPLNGVFMKMLSGISGPMIFLAVLWGIYSIGDISAFSVLGKKLLGYLLLFLCVISAVTDVVVLPLFQLVQGVTASGGGFNEVFQMLLDIVPGNIILPFAEGNTLQILFIGIVMGVAMIIIGDKTQNVALFAEQLNYIVQLVMDAISRLVPAFVFGSLLDLILSGQLSQIGVSYKLFLINVIFCVVMIGVYALIVGARMKVSPILYLKKAAKTLIICFTTASSAAAFSTSIETCVKEYGVDERFTNFGIPFSQIIYKPCASVLYFTSMVYLAEVYGVAVSPAWFATAFIMAVVLSIATPPIPGGTLASISVLCTQLGLPLEGIPVILTIGVLIDFFATPQNIFGCHTILILAADKFGLLNKDTLRN